MLSIILKSRNVTPIYNLMVLSNYRKICILTQEIYVLVYHLCFLRLLPVFLSFIKKNIILVLKKNLFSAHNGWGLLFLKIIALICHKLFSDSFETISKHLAQLMYCVLHGLQKRFPKEHLSSRTFIRKLKYLNFYRVWLSYFSAYTV